MTPTPNFVHLHVHSEYSIANGMVRLKPLVKRCVELGMPAVAITDQSNLFGLVKFYKAACGMGIKPLVGVDMFVRHEADPNRPHRMVLLCQNTAGYLNLTRLVTRSFVEGQHYGVPQIEQAWLDGASDGLIALSAGTAGDIGLALLADNRVQAQRHLETWARYFPNRFYIELQRTGRERDEAYVQAALDLAAQSGTPVVATNDVHFLHREDFEAHETRVCIFEGRTLDDPRRPRVFNESQYLRSAQEMATLFVDAPEALANSVEIAKRCNLELKLGNAVLPAFPVPVGLSESDYMRQRAHQGLADRLDFLFPDPAQRDAESAVYTARLARELDVIINMGFAGYFLIVSDFIQWAKDNGIPVGPGRGSGAGSLVAYVLKITDLDPLRYDLLFERFLNPERVSMPDFDVDFCMDNRDRVIDYVVQTYGRERVSQIITYGTMAAKAVVRDVGRVLGHPYGMVDKLAKLIPFEIGITLEKALEDEEQLRTRYEAEDDVRALIDLARKLEGLTRNAGKHAGGVVIAPTALTDFTPLYCERGGTSTVTQFDKDDVEAAGLVKFDFLGLRTLTIIDWAVKAINRQRAKLGEPMLDITRIELDDKSTYDLLKAYKTTAVFQLESRGMKDLIKRLQPDRFEDIVALVALFRPGPLQSGMVDDFINRKHGRTTVVYPHPELEPILKPTYGVILYQEQVMQIAQVLAGYTLGSADLLRRAMGKKKPEEMAKQRVIFTQGAMQRGVDEKIATHIFDLMEKFAGYGFNKSHSAAYALLSYQTAWLKARYPAAFMAAVLSADMDNTDKVVTLIDECRDMKLSVRPPDVNLSVTPFTVTEDGRIQYGLGAVKGVGVNAVDELVKEREQAGKFTDLFQFCRRLDAKRVSRRMLEQLIRAGAFDLIGPHRATLMASLGNALQAAEQEQRDATAGQVDLFGSRVGNADATRITYSDAPEWTEEQRLLGEKETLGLYLTGHPIKRYMEELKRFTTCRIVDLKPDREQKVLIAGLVVALRTMNSKRGDRMAFITLDDRSGRVELAVFPESYKRYREYLVLDKLLVVQGNVTIDEYSGNARISIDQIMDINEARATYAKRLVVDMQGTRHNGAFVSQLAQMLQPHRSGNCAVLIRYAGAQERADIALGADWRVKPNEELLQQLARAAGAPHVRLEY